MSYKHVDIITLIVIVVVVLSVFLVVFLLKDYSTPIDAVITHVDLSDPLLQKQLLEYSELTGTKNSKKKWRWDSNGEAKYCILSIQKYAPFIRNIFLVVSGPTQVPKWLDQLKGVTVVYHADFFKDLAHLPTFNSMSIEYNLHRINGLSEHYLYFNDDVFICKPVTIKDFIINDKLIIGLEKGNVTPVGVPTSNDIGFISAWKNTNKLLDTINPNSGREFLRHIPQIQRISDHEKLIEMFPESYELTSSSKFRNTKCNLISAGFAEWYALYNKTAIVEYNMDSGMFFITDDPTTNTKTFDHLKSRKYKFLNLQNSMANGIENFHFKSFMEIYFA